MQPLDPQQLVMWKLLFVKEWINILANMTPAVSDQGLFYD